MRVHIPIFILYPFSLHFSNSGFKKYNKRELTNPTSIKKKNHAVNLGKSSENWLEREVIQSASHGFPYCTHTLFDL